MKTSWVVIVGAAVIVGIFVSIGLWQSRPVETQISLPTPTSGASQNEPFSLKSPAFLSGGFIPVAYTCDGEDLRPALTISGAPAEAKSLAIVMYDPDAPGGTFVHWVAWNIPPETKEIPEGPLNPSIMEGTTSFQSVGYLGPCPPGGTHRYIWRLYALRTVLSLDSKTTRDGLEAAMNTFVLTQTELMGRYTKQ